MDRFIETLFQTGRATVEMTGMTSAMLLGTYEDEEKICLILGQSATEKEAYLRYIQALMLCLFIGTDTLYELRDVFMTHTPDEDVDVSLLPEPSEDPAATNALLVIRTPFTDEEEQTSWVLTYGIDDEGRPVFAQDPEDSGGGFEGPYFTALNDAIKRWQDTGRRVLPKEEILDMKNRAGFMGRLS